MAIRPLQQDSLKQSDNRDSRMASETLTIGPSTYLNQRRENASNHFFSRNHVVPNRSRGYQPPWSMSQSGARWN